MNLFNSLPVPSGIRRCYWDSEYIASQPFCITSKLTEKEAKEMADFEELKFWERNEALKQDLGFDMQFESVEPLDHIQKKCIDVERAIFLYSLAPKKYRFSGFAKNAKQVGCYNIQPSGRHLPKTKELTQQLRASFLTR